MPKSYSVYILSNRHKRIYVGVTSDLPRRVYQHKHHLCSGFTKRYNIDQLVHFEEADDPMTAICREKQIKGWLRKKKIELIERENPEWKDLAEDWDWTDYL